jgi:hypothetical protein
MHQNVIQHPPGYTHDLLVSTFASSPETLRIRKGLGTACRSHSGKFEPPRSYEGERIKAEGDVAELQNHFQERSEA